MLIENELNLYTQKIIYWIDYHGYSQMHWETVAKEIWEETAPDLEEAITRLSFAIRAFHIKFQDAVVKPGNVLYDLIDIAFVSVDWDRVAAHCYSKIPEITGGNL